MQLFSILLAVAAPNLVYAVQFTGPASVFESGLTTGIPFDITWDDANGAVTLLLKNGLATNLQTVITIASGLTGNSYSWTPSTALPSGSYALEIEDSTGIPNYSFPFQLTGASLSLTTTSQPSTSATTSKETASSSTEKSTTSTSSAISTAIASTSTTSSGSAPSLSITSQTPSASQPSTSSSTSASTTSQPSATLLTVHPGLTTGAKAGIGVGVTFGVLSMIGLAALAFWWGKRSSKSNPNPEALIGPAELETRKPRGAGLILDDTLKKDEKTEMAKGGRLAEIENGQPKGAELTGDAQVNQDEKPEPQREKTAAELEIGTTRGAELLGDEPLNENEKAELGRRRAAELEAKDLIEIGAGGARAELEMRRKLARDLFEIG